MGCTQSPFIFRHPPRDVARRAPLPCSLSRRARDSTLLLSPLGWGRFSRDTGPAGRLKLAWSEASGPENHFTETSMRALTLAIVLSLPAIALAEAKFTQQPKVVPDGQGVKITFAVDAPADVEVAVLDAKGQIVRHLAAGMLGPKARRRWRPIRSSRRSPGTAPTMPASRWPGRARSASGSAWRPRWKSRLASRRRSSATSSAWRSAPRAICS